MIPQLHSSPVIDRLARYGYFHSPEALAVGGVSNEDVKRLTIKDDVVIAAARQYQRIFLEELDPLVARYHNGRAANPDGGIGPATFQLLVNEPRCGCPDFFAADDSAGKASFPESCRTAITTSYNLQGLEGLTQAEVKSAWIEADGNWSKVIDVDFVLANDQFPNTMFWAVLEALSGNTLAYHYLTQGNCSARLKGAYDRRIWSLLLLIATITHEHGHGLGFQHITSDNTATMYPMITQAAMNRRGAPNQSDIRQAINSHTYVLRKDPPDEPDDPEDPKDPPTKPTWDLTIHRPLKAGRYKLVADRDGDGIWTLS